MVVKHAEVRVRFGWKAGLFLAAVTLATAALAAELPSSNNVKRYGAVGDGKGEVATQVWLQEKGYPIAKTTPDHTVIGIVYGGGTDDPRMRKENRQDGDLWYSCGWSGNKFWHYLFAIARYDAEEDKWDKIPIKEGETVYVENENAYYAVVGSGTLHKAYVPDEDTMDYVGIQEAAYANPLGRIYIPRGPPGAYLNSGAGFRGLSGVQTATSLPKPLGTGWSPPTV